MNEVSAQPSSNTLVSPAQSISEGRVAGFSVHLENFDGPFDLLLQLISRHRMDITDVAIATVTDEFIGYIRELEKTEAGWKLDHASEFVDTYTNVIIKGNVDDVIHARAKAIR